MGESAECRERLGPLEILIFLIAAAGMAFRVGIFASSRELWIDEATLANSIVALRFSEVFNPQNATAGFLFLQKCLYLLLPWDFSFRVVPCIFGLAAVHQMDLLCRRVLSKPGEIIVMLAFCFSPDLIYFAGEGKQYTLDLFVAIVLLRLTLYCSDRPPSKVLPIAAPVLAVQLFSHPAFFMAVLMACYLLLVNPAWRKLPMTILIGSGVLLTVLYFYSYSPIRNRPYMQSFWDWGFLPADWRLIPSWFCDRTAELFAFLFNHLTAWVTFPFFIAGSIYWLRRDPKLYFLFIGPIPMLILTAAVRCYPYSGERLSMFLDPGVLIVFGGVVEYLAIQFRYRIRLLGALCFCLAGAITWWQGRGIVGFVFYGVRQTRALRDLTEHVVEQSRAGDLLVADFVTFEKFKLYWGYTTSRPLLAVARIDLELERYYQRKNSKLPGMLSGRRFWFWNRTNPSSFPIELTACFSAIRKPVEAIGKEKEELRLFDFSGFTADDRGRLESCLQEIVLPPEAPRR